MSDGKGFVVVHVGAGYHSLANSELYKGVCREACLQAVSLLKKKQSALDAVVAAICELENSPWTNAGTGSNLTLSGTVECDASVMDGHSLHYGAVGAVSGVKNPIKVAESLLQTQQEGTMSLGRIPPSTLVGRGAKDWATRKGIPLTVSNELITDVSKSNYQKHKRKLELLEDGPQKVRRVTDGVKYQNSPQSRGASNGSKVAMLVNGTPQGHPAYDATIPVQHSLYTTTPHGPASSPVMATGPYQNYSKRQESYDGASNMIPAPSQISTIPQHKVGQDHTGTIEQAPQIPNRQAEDTTSSVPYEIPLVPSGSEHRPLDTVGAICVDHMGHIVSAVSSGGIALKQPGRLGQAALYGSGCWAENDAHEKLGVGLSTSGCGEHLTKTLLARECASALKEHVNPADALLDVFQTKFIESRFLSDVPEKLGGTLAVKLDTSIINSQHLEVLWAHTTESMCLAFMSTGDEQPHALISRLPKTARQGRSCLVQSKVYDL